MKILFDTLGAQVQMHLSTGKRLTTWFDSLTRLGYDYSISTLAPLDAQLKETDVYVSLTRQSAGVSLAAEVGFSYTPDDLYALQQWVQGGGSVLMFTNHSGFPTEAEKTPLWPIFEIQLAAALNIQLVFASFAPTGSSPIVSNPCHSTGKSLTLRMSPPVNAPNLPAELVQGVSTVEALDSGGIVTAAGMVTAGGIPIIDLPGSADCIDKSGMNHPPETCSFAALYTFGTGKVIVVGHSGIAGDADTCKPSLGQIESADNLAFLNNCITYLGS